LEACKVGLQAGWVICGATTLVLVAPMALGEIGAALVKMMRSCQTELMQSKCQAFYYRATKSGKLQHALRPWRCLRNDGYQTGDMIDNI
jgi:hypothetical protein